MFLLPIVVFEYSLYEEDYEDCAAFQLEPQEFFTFFWLNSQCSACSTTFEVVAYECA